MVNDVRRAYFYAKTTRDVYVRLPEEDPEACADFPELIVGTDCDYDKVPFQWTNAIIDGTLNGRDGKGIIWIFSSGNSFDELDDVMHMTLEDIMDIKGMKKGHAKRISRAVAKLLPH